VPKNTEAGKSMPFGSVFKWNRARSLFEVRQCQEPGQDIIELGLYHRKCNEGRLLKPIGLRLEFHNKSSEVLESVVFNETDIREVPELAKGLKLKDRLIALLKEGNMAVAELADATETTAGTVRAELNRHKNIFQRLGEEWELMV